MTIPPQLLMMLPSLLGSLSGGGKEQGGLMSPPIPNLLGGGPGGPQGGGQGGFPGMGGMEGLMGPLLQSPLGEMTGMSAFQGPIPAFLGAMGKKPSPLFGLGMGPGMLGSFL